MIIFTPNTVIKSADVNLNNNGLNDRLTAVETAVYAYGTLGSELSGYKTFTETANNGITKTNATTYTIVTAGLYVFHAQQLMNTTGATNFWSYVNSTGIHHGWQQTIQKDVSTTFTRLLSVGDTVRCYIDGGVATVWTAEHSVYYLNLLYRT